MRGQTFPRARPDVRATCGSRRRRDDLDVPLRPGAEVAVGRSVELVVHSDRELETKVQPAANNAIGEMGVRGELSPGRRKHIRRNTGPVRHGGICSARGDATGVEVAKVHVETFYFPSPVARHEWQMALRAVAHDPTERRLRRLEIRSILSPRAIARGKRCWPQYVQPVQRRRRRPRTERMNSSWRARAAPKNRAPADR